MEKEDIKAISDLATDKEFIVLSDEIYEKIIYDKKHYSFQTYTDNAVTINGFSKAYAMTGLRVGYCASNPDIIEEILKVFCDTEDYGTILRAKGMVESTDGTWIYFDMVPGEYELREGQPDYTGRLCVIGTDIDEHKLLELFGIA